MNHKLLINEIERKDRQLSLFICVYFLFNNLNSVLQKVFGLSGASLQITKLIMQLFLILLIIKSINGMRIKDVGKYIFVAVFIGGLIGYSLLIGTPFSMMRNFAVSMLTVSLPLGVAAYLVRNKAILYEYLLDFSYPILIVLFVNMFAVNDLQYDMHFSYGILLLILIHLNEWAHKKKWYLLILALIEIVMMLIFGSRGAVVCIAVFIIFKVLDNSTASIKKRLLHILGSFLILFVLYSLIDKLLPVFISHLAGKGISSRTLNLFLQGNFLSHDSGRNEIWDTTIQLIKSHPLTGWGIAGASDLLGSKAVYPHQLFLDLLLTFGIFLGTLFTIIIIFMLRKVFTAKDIKERELIQIFVCMSFIRLMFSATLFTDYTFAIMMGLLLSCNKYESYLIDSDYETGNIE